jgi:transmembrane sensor
LQRNDGANHSVASDADIVSAEAAIWLARLERGLQPQEGRQLRQWLQQPTQCDAIVAAAKLWHGPDIIAVLADMVPVGFGNPLVIKKKRLHPASIAFGLCLAIIIGAPFLLARHVAPGLFSAAGKSGAQILPWGELIFRTKPGETRAVTLQDGSKITLNSHTQLGVQFGAGIRQAFLAYGEAIFQIAPELRPFEIDAGGRHFKAPPSRFDIHIINPQTIELLVLDGGVTVRGLPWHRPATPAEARMFDPAAFADTTVGPLQAALLEDQLISRQPISAASAHERLRWQPQDIVYVSSQ